MVDSAARLAVGLIIFSKYFEKYFVESGAKKTLSSAGNGKVLMLWDYFAVRLWKRAGRAPCVRRENHRKPSLVVYIKVFGGFCLVVRTEDKKDYLFLIKFKITFCIIKSPFYRWLYYKIKDFFVSVFILFKKLYSFILIFIQTGLPS